MSDGHSLDWCTLKDGPTSTTSGSPLHRSAQSTPSMFLRFLRVLMMFSLPISSANVYKAVIDIQPHLIPLSGCDCVSVLMLQLCSRGDSAAVQEEVWLVGHCCQQRPPPVHRHGGWSCVLMPLTGRAPSPPWRRHSSCGRFISNMFVVSVLRCRPCM